MKLDYQDLRFALLRLPKKLFNAMQKPEWIGKIFVGGGYLRSIVSGEKINDVDVFVGSVMEAELLAYQLCNEKKDVYKTDNAFTILNQKMTIQIIHRWLFAKAEDVTNSFDFTVCCAAIYFKKKYNDEYKNEFPENWEKLSEEEKLKGEWDSYCDDRFYIDIASKRLVYRCPVRNEDAGGSMLRVLKYYQKGYRIPLDSLGAVMARMVKEIDTERVYIKDEKAVAKILTGLLREVDPQIDPEHLAHLPSQKEKEDSKEPE